MENQSTNNPRFRCNICKQYYFALDHPIRYICASHDIFCSKHYKNNICHGFDSKHYCGKTPEILTWQEDLCIWTRENFQETKKEENKTGFAAKLNGYKLNHLIETELKVIEKKSKSLYLKSTGRFTEYSDEDYWKVSINEFMKYVYQRSQIIIDQLSKKSHAVDVTIDESGD